MAILDHLICLPRNLYAGQEATVRTLYGKTDWFKIGKEVCKAVYCHPIYLTYIHSKSCKNAGLDESQAEIKIAGRNINNLTYPDDTTLMEESKEELKGLQMKVKKENLKN